MNTSRESERKYRIVKYSQSCYVVERRNIFGYWRVADLATSVGETDAMFTTEQEAREYVKNCETPQRGEVLPW